MVTTTPLTSGSGRWRGKRSETNPVLVRSPRQTREAAMGKRPRPAYAPLPVGASREEILTAKSQIVGHRKGIANAKLAIASMEARLSAMDPQRVVACVVRGYTDPPARVAQAAADKAAGIHSIVGQYCTPEHLKAFAAGTLKVPEFQGFFHVIHDLKQRIVHNRWLVEHTEAHNDYLESDLSQLDPQHVVAAKVADYKDHPEIVARAAAAKAAGDTPATNEGM